jgi:catechol 1,2-dioxygenase
MAPSATGTDFSNTWNGVSIASNKSVKPIKSRYDPTFTDSVIAATGPKASPRMAQVMPSLIRHLHDFAREVDLTVEEWMAAIEVVSTHVEPRG